VRDDGAHYNELKGSIARPKISLARQVRQHAILRLGDGDADDALDVAREATAERFMAGRAY
jgi:hypothetical protein